MSLKRLLLLLRNTLLYGGLTKDAFHDIQPGITQKNYSALLWSSGLGAALLFGMSGLSLFLDSRRPYLSLYASFCLILTFLFAFTGLVLRKHKQATLGFIYLFMVIAYAFSILLGVWKNVDVAATTFCVLLFALPLLIIDKPIRVLALLTGVTACFCTASALIKPPSISEYDLGNAISFLLLGAAVDIHVIQNKLQDLVNRRHIEQEHDTDELTHLLTRAAAERDFAIYAEKTQAFAAMLVIDLDNFKQINDSLGHVFGDAVLRTMGTCLQTVFRKSDVLCRYGGDEFVVFLPYASDRACVEGCVEKLHAEMANRFAAREQTLATTGSIGVAFYPSDGTTFEELFMRADEALYKAKRSGKDTCRFYSDICA